MHFDVQDDQTAAAAVASPQDDKRVVDTIRNYIRMDNAKKVLSGQMKELREPTQKLKQDVIRYMVAKDIKKIPTKSKGEEFLELKSKVKTRKPTKEEMIEAFTVLIQSKDALDKSPEDIVDLITRRVTAEETYELYRHCKRKPKGESKGHRAVRCDNGGVDNGLFVRCIRELIADDESRRVDNACEAPAFKRRSVQESMQT